MAWLVGAVGSTLAYRKARLLLRRSRYVVAAVFLSAAVMVIWIPVSVTDESSAFSAFTPSDPPNSPIGVGKGIHPGRVVWVHDPSVTQWDGLRGDWWYDENTDQDLADFMVVEAIRCLTGQREETAAWDALFRYFNQVHDNGDVGYREGEKVTIKLNMNQDNTTVWKAHGHLPSPQVTYALVDQLINVAGVPGEAITLYDASRYIGDPIYNKIRDNPDPNFHRIRFIVRPDYARNGRQGALHDPDNPVYFATPNIPGGIQAYLPQCVSEATYLINIALLRPHQGFGVTLCGKNHFGTVYFPYDGGWTPKSLHEYGYRNSPMGRYNCLVDLIGHRHLGDKTLIYLIDGLYAGRTEGSEVIRYEFFGDDWCSSLFASQDPVAIDSVALDFLRNEPRATECRGMGVDNYLHEAALAHNPPSGTIYDPDGDGTPLDSLGVHEHWNNEVDKQYSRNLGIADGIELIRPMVTDPNGPVENRVTGTRYAHIRHAVNDANVGDEIVVSAGIYRERFAQIDCPAPTVNYSNVEGSFPGSGNIDLNPGFVVPGYWAWRNDIDRVWVHGDYHLHLDSPCINAGDPDYVGSEAVDIDGEPRVMAGRVDMGCDEVDGTIACSN